MTVSVTVTVTGSGVSVTVTVAGSGVGVGPSGGSVVGDSPSVGAGVGGSPVSVRVSAGEVEPPNVHPPPVPNEIYNHIRVLPVLTVWFRPGDIPRGRNT